MYKRFGASFAQYFFGHAGTSWSTKSSKRFCNHGRKRFFISWVHKNWRKSVISIQKVKDAHDFTQWTNWSSSRVTIRSIAQKMPKSGYIGHFPFRGQHGRLLWFCQADKSGRDGQWSTLLQKIRYVIHCFNPYWQISGTFLRPFYWKTHPSKNPEYLFSF